MITLTDCWYEYPANREEDTELTPEAQPAVRGVSFSVKEGEFLCIVGHNGSGKSTIAKLMNALYLPSSGNVSVLGMDTKDEMLTQDIRRTVGLVQQNPDNQIVTTIVEEDVAFGLENIGVPPPEIRARVDEALAAVGLTKYATAAPHMLSGGQKQRVAIAGVLAMQTRVMVMDEPTAMLDPSGRREVLETMEKLRREKGLTLVLITHFMEEAMRADRVIVMEDGEVSMEGPPREVLSNVEGLKRAGLEPPHALVLANRLRARGISLPSDIMTGEELVEGIVKAGKFRREMGHPLPRYARLSKASNRRAARYPSGQGSIWIQTRDLTHVYMEGSPSQAVAIENVTLTVGENEFIGVIGHTGSGKSTLVQHMNGLLRPNSGIISVNGVEIPKKGGDMRAIRRTVGMVFQYPEYQLFDETVEKDIAFGPKNLGLTGEELTARVKEAMRDVGLRYELYAPRSPFDLSGGEKRRAAIAGVLAMQPKVLVLDEPTAGLDPRGREEILGLVARWRGNGRTVVMISHGMDDIARYCTRVLVMSGGKLLMQGTPAEVFEHSDKLRSIGLGLPAAAGIAQKLRDKGVRVARGIVSMSRLEPAIVMAMGGYSRGVH